MATPDQMLEIDRLAPPEMEMLTANRLLRLLSQDPAFCEPAGGIAIAQAFERVRAQLSAEPSELSSRPGPYRGLAAWQVRRVTDFMRDHLDQPLTLDTLAGLVKLSRHHFCTAFRLATGRTPHDWLVRQRIAKARQLLASTSTPVTEIALEVGYETPSAFASAFRKHVGLTPSDYRRRF